MGGRCALNPGLEAGRRHGRLIYASSPEWHFRFFLSSSRKVELVNAHSPYAIECLCSCARGWFTENGSGGVRVTRLYPHSGSCLTATGPLILYSLSVGLQKASAITGGCTNVNLTPVGLIRPPCQQV